MYWKRHAKTRTEEKSLRKRNEIDVWRYLNCHQKRSYSNLGLKLLFSNYPRVSCRPGITVIGVLAKYESTE